MRIVIPVFGFGASGGARVFGKLADCFTEKGHDVIILAPEGRHSPYFPIKSKIVTYPFYFSSIPVVRYFSCIFSMLFTLLAYRKVTDVFLATGNMTAYPVFFASIFSKKGFYYIQAYEPDFYKEKKGFISLIEQSLARLSYRLPLLRIVNSDIYKNYKEISSNCVVEPGIDLDVFYPREEREKKADIIIGCIGRNELWKGTRLIIEAVKSLRVDSGLNIKLKVAFQYPEGYDGSDYSFVERIQPHGDHNLANFYRSTDIFCATGLIQNGGFHYPCMEAMATGVSVISNYSPADNLSAITLELVSVESIKTAILKVLNTDNDNLIAMRKFALNKVSLYSWDVVSDKMLNCFYFYK